VRFRNQPFEIGPVAEDGVDVNVIGNVVSEIGHGRSEYRRDPDRINSKVDEVRQPFDNSIQVPHPIVVRILK
jgi:hypothetical protein